MRVDLFIAFSTIYNRCHCIGADGDGCDGYGRCTTVRGVEVDHQWLNAISCVGNVLGCDFEYANIRHSLAALAIDRKINEADYAFNAMSGYYGEELDSVEMHSGDWNEIEKIVKDVMAADSHIQAVKMACQLEYGYVSPALEKMGRAGATNIFIKDIKTSHKKSHLYCRQFFPMPIVRREGRGYRVVDGNHRINSYPYEDLFCIVVS